MEEKEKRLNSIMLSYYSRKDIQEAIVNFCKNREAVPRHFDKFSKRPDILEYPSEIINQVRKGFTSFHCSEELWENPLELSTELTPEQLSKLRIGWDLLIDIDCKWFDYSKKACLAILEALEHHGVKNFGVKFSGSKGFHILVPWKAFPKIINNQETKDLFPELPRKILSYLKFYSERIMKNSLPEDFLNQFKDVKIKKGIKCKNCNQISSSYNQVEFECEKCFRKETRKFDSDKKLRSSYKCPECKSFLTIKDSREIYECKKCNINSSKNNENFTEQIEVDLFDLMGLDIILVSSRHLFRCPYSLHEKGLVSLPLSKEEIANFEPKLASPLRVKIKNFYPEAEEGEARELVISSLDFHKEPKKEKQNKAFTTIKIDKRNIIAPPCIENILKGLSDGKKRGLFVLINYFRALGLEFDEIQEKIEEWNKKNKPPLKTGYILSQINWTQRQKPLLPFNCDKEFYKGIGVCKPDSLCQKIKNPVNYSVLSQLKNQRKKEK